MAKKIGTLKIYLIIAAALVVFLPPFAKYQELRHKNAKLRERIAELERQNKDFAEAQRRLTHDITYVEMKAREKIGLVRKGEIVLKDMSGQDSSRTE